MTRLLTWWHPAPPPPNPGVWYCPVKGSGTPSSSSEPVLETNVRFLYNNTAIDCLTMATSLDSSFGNWMSKVCDKLVCDMGQWTKSDVLLKPSQIAIITGCGLLWKTTTLKSLPSTSFPIPFIIRRMVEIEHIGNILHNSTTIFRCRSDYIVCVCDISHCNTTMCPNRNEPLFHSLLVCDLNHFTCVNGLP